ncbi:VOC family protein [Sulfitobacter albidus]|uniref:VOC family protein n=1 Tax=Sulfitobacter albidus TaxID=2829501 RepID=A0A975PMS1_9RHOB|nr:VOC family protein [Sulfitobacter albidus]QUJ76716.1 VOC family protein [Sulfitobacter albidus]
MPHPSLGIDHCFALVHDLETAAAQYRKLGFTLSPRGEHSAEKGSANYTIMFPNDYFELLGLTARTPLNSSRAEILQKQGEGLHAIACRIKDAAAGAEALKALGISAGKTGSFERPVPLPGGGTARAAFTTLPFAPAEVPRGIVFMCEHHTPDSVWLPELIDHPNGASGLSAIVALSDAPVHEAAQFARLWAEGRVTTTAEETRIDTGPASAPVILMTPAQMAQAYPGVDATGTAEGAFTVLRLSSDALEQSRAAVEATGIRPIPTARGFAIPAEYASGVVLEFCAKASDAERSRS